MPRTYNVVSPHLDDAALSCALFLAANPGSCLITVFAAGPASVSPLTTWDRAARYFKDGADVMAVRRGEDAEAAALVRAAALHLPYWDRQYRNEQYRYDGPAEDELAPAIAADLLAQAAKQPRPWLIPLGLGHPDHRLATEAALFGATQTWNGRPAPPPSPGAAEVYVYADLPYAVEDPAGVTERKRYLAERGFALEEDGTLEFTAGRRPKIADRRLKAAVLRCHKSQRRILRRRAHTAIRTPERIWRLVPR
jgi:LmbE family N-acetylglucosaminyl deacetylase